MKPLQNPIFYHSLFFPFAYAQCWNDKFCKAFKQSITSRKRILQAFRQPENDGNHIHQSKRLRGNRGVRKGFFARFDTQRQRR